MCAHVCVCLCGQINAVRERLVVLCVRRRRLSVGPSIDRTHTVRVNES